MKIVIFILLFVTSVVNCLETSGLIKKAVSIANNAYAKYYLTSVVWVGRHNQMATDFLKHYKGTVVTVSIHEDFDWNNTDFHRSVSYKQTVFFAENAEEFEYFLKIINRAIAIPIQVIVVIGNREITTDVSTEFMRRAWENDVADIVLVGYDDDVTIAMKTYLPYENGGCGNYTPIYLNSTSREYFTRKFRNFNGCPIRVTLLDFIPYVKLIKENGTIVSIEGIDGNVLKLIMEKLNSTIDVVSLADDGAISACVNGTRVGSFNDLVYNIADIMVPSFIIVTTRYAVSQISYVYYTVNVVWCLPNRRVIYRWVKAILPFLNLSTPIIISAIFIIITILRLFKCIGNIKDLSLKGNLFEMLGIFLGQQVNINAKYQIINILFMFWVWFSLVVRISYQGKLINGLQKTILEPPIETLSEAINVVDELGGMPTFIELYKNTTVEDKYNNVKLSEIPNYLQDIASGRKFLLAVDNVHIKYYRPDLQILEERVTSIPACIHMRPRWPAAPEISRAIGELVQSGFIVKIWKQMINEWLLVHGRQKQTNTFKPLNMEILSSCFYGLIIMYCISFLIFSLEIILYQYKSAIKRLLKYR